MSNKLKLFIIAQLLVVVMLLGCSTSQPYTYTDRLTQRTYLVVPYATDVYVTYGTSGKTTYLGYGRTFYLRNGKPYSVVFYHNKARCVWYL